MSESIAGVQIPDTRLVAEAMQIAEGAGPRQIQTAVLFPSWHRSGQGRLPVLLDPYGGPHAQRVIKARGAYLDSQWFA